ncbi:VCBS repeat-containing protein, partial [Streptomyces olivoreticuli]
MRTGPIRRLAALIAAGAAALALAGATTNASASVAGNSSDVLWHNTTTGELAAWLLDGRGNVTSDPRLSWRCGPDCTRDWKVVGTGDFNGDGRTDVLWHNTTTGELATWLLDGRGNVTGDPRLSWKCGPDCTRDWKVVGTGDFNGDGRTDVLWHNTTTGELATWLLDGKGNVMSDPRLSWKCGPDCTRDWKVVGTGDFNGDGRTDVLWH